MEALEKKLGQKGIVVLPQEWREDLGLKPRHTVILQKTSLGIIVRPKIEKPVEALKGIAKLKKGETSLKLTRKIRKKIDEEERSELLV